MSVLSLRRLLLHDTLCYLYDLKDSAVTDHLHRGFTAFSSKLFRDQSSGLPGGALQNLCGCEMGCVELFADGSGDVVAGRRYLHCKHTEA